MELQIDNTRFVESSNVPRDATIVGKTWQYVNKSGGPDRRYKNNRQSNRIPEVTYNTFWLKRLNDVTAT